MLRFAGPIAASAVLFILAGCGSSPPASPPLRPVRTLQVGKLSAVDSREFPGRAKAKDEVELSFQVAGPLISLPVDVGANVKKGDVIAVIDPRDFEAALANSQGNLERAKANLLAMERGARPEEIEQLKAAVDQAVASYDQAAAEHARNEVLVVSKTVSQSDFDITLARKQRTEAEVKNAKEALNIGMTGAREEDLNAKKAEIRALEAAVAGAKNQLDYSTLTAPFDAEVAAKYVENFQSVQPKQNIVRLLNTSKIEITIQVPETLISLVPQVKRVACRFDAFPDQEFFGKVTKIGSEASQTTRTYPVTIEIDQPEDVRILPGMAATVRHSPEETNGDAPTAMIVPASALFTPTDAPGSFVWIVDPSSKTVARREVKTGKLTPVGVTIDEGLAGGDLVVISGANMLRDGQEVKLP
ncbi:efflux RND transporter periplasmic adaptor subunit [Blastopirellula sp. JC732]|uniref:Efflux RND transporter periplasmic adaptor subunit n=1 Tax=Blastopirellula sediminis TaxID=2894196 RepID=A0A9X1SJK4_9BACT|nr:efflux RND transporter periplasmic adaptor subunit [Blastopirellula sediminis]MCC9608278.1 efflux RND transporter periplasmic adaptor subunit [Blastopirellula sediminis]MCC9628949.1 efflux RND transporter periplasmic adaptor subunit [Blastopirellula sediminis]